MIFPDREGNNSSVYNELDDFLGKITQDNSGKIWVCGTGTVYQLNISPTTGEVNDVVTYALEGAEMEDIYPLRKDKKLYFITLLGTYRLEKDELVPDSSILPELGENARLIAHDDKMLWISDGIKWYNTSGIKSQYLNLFNCIPELSDVIAGDKNSA